MQEVTADGAVLGRSLLADKLGLLLGTADKSSCARERHENSISDNIINLLLLRHQLKMAASDEFSMATALRILLVDDFKAWRKFASSLIAKRFDWCIVGEAADGTEAVQKAEELQPDLVLLDIKLPKLNGIEAARQIRKLASKSKILFLSQVEDPETVEEALATGASGYVSKWNAGSELLKAMESAFEGQIAH